MEVYQIFLIVLGIVIFLAIVLFIIIRKRRKKVWIFRDTKKSPEKTEEHFWVKDRKFKSLNSARHYARSL